MTGSFIITLSASRDIDGILEYVLEHSSPKRALHVHKRLYEGFSKVGAQPALDTFATTWLTNRFAFMPYSRT